MSKTCIFNIVLLLMLLKGHAQHSYEAVIPAPENQGYHRVNITPEISAFSRFPDLRDLRIYDDEGMEVPYLLTREAVYQEETTFSELKIADREYTRNQSILVFDNTEKSRLDHLYIRSKNAQASKYARLTGSDDKQNWYIVKDRFHLSPGTSDKHATSEIFIDFPLIDYRYLRLLIDEDSNSAPLNIRSAGIYEHLVRHASYQPLQQPELTITDSAKTTWIKIDLKSPYIIDLMEFSISAPPHYLRKAILYKYYSKKDGTLEKIHLENFELSSQRVKSLAVENTKARYLLIRIENHDNPPLRIDSINFFQLQRYLTANLEPEHQYQLRCGNDSLSIPQYDLRFFSAQLAKELPTIYPIDGREIVNPEIATEELATNEMSSLYIWIALVVIGGMLLLMSVKMVKDLGKEKKS